MESLKPLPVLTKHDFSYRYSQGQFGNASLTWDTFSDYVGSGYQGLIHLRNRVKGGLTWYSIRVEEAFRVYEQAILEGLVKPRDIYVSAMVDPNYTVFQGEVFRCPRHYSLFYSCLKRTMREGLKEDGRQVYGLEAKCLIDYYLPEPDKEWLYHLLDTYPDHVVELSRYDREIGTIPGYHTIYWEIRRY